MGEDEGKSRGAMADPHHHDHHHHQQQHYGTFQGVPDYYQPAIGFPQPVPPPGAASAPPMLPRPYTQPPYPGAAYYPHGYQAGAGYVAIVEGTPLRMRRLPCCGMGIGWVLFIIGFFLAAIPWYVGAFILFCVRIDYREKPGFIACTIAAILAGIAIILGAKGADAW